MHQRYLLALALALATVIPARAEAQEITDENYLRYVPLTYPRLTRQTDASARFRLWGDTASAEYRDVDPLDGIDDARMRHLHALALRFSPFLVLNSFSAPHDVAALMQARPVFNLIVDTWNLAQGQELIHRETINFNTLGRPCTDLDRDGRTGDVSADCRILELLDEFDPETPLTPWAQVRAVDLASDPFRIMYFDMPGRDEDSWKAAWRNPVTSQLRTEFRDKIKIYAHPFVAVHADASGEADGYELVIQYWFYYPLNDGGNNHEGDWEHINVVLTTRDRIAEPLRAADVRALLDDRVAPEDIVIARVEYYFHHKLMTLDYTRPNVYQERESWEREWRSMPRNQIGIERLWQTIRHYAYRDEEESELNTHPIAYIGADNKGLDQLISRPGGRNQDSHGTFPMPGLFKTVGPAGSAEQITHAFDHKQWYANLPASAAPSERDFGAGHALTFDSSTLDVLPDWERVLPLVRRDPDVRRRWAWLVLPIRWGYPASPSPLAGLVANADMGNVGPIGPAYNAGWNRPGPGRGFEEYHPHVLPSYFPVDIQDGFSNNLGYFNVLPAMVNLPPLDLIWRGLAIPFRAAFKRQDPIFFPEETVPTRFVGLVGGATYTRFPENLWNAAAHLSDDNAVDVGGEPLPSMIVEILNQLLAVDSAAGGDLPLTSISDAAWGWQGHVAFYVGERFMSSTGIRHTRNRVGFDQPLTVGGTYSFRADVNWWDITGNLRYNLFTSAFKPYVNVGYGVNWYQVENATGDGEPFDAPSGGWINNFWPPTWQYGFGAELMLVQSLARIPAGIDVGIRAEYLWHNSPSGITLPGIFPIRTLQELGKRWVRGALNLSATVSF